MVTLISKACVYFQNYGFDPLAQYNRTFIPEIVFFFQKMTLLLFSQSFFFNKAQTPTPRSTAMTLVAGGSSGGSWSEFPHGSCNLAAMARERERVDPREEREGEERGGDVVHEARFLVLQLAKLQFVLFSTIHMHGPSYTSVEFVKNDRLWECHLRGSFGIKLIRVAPYPYSPVKFVRMSRLLESSRAQMAIGNRWRRGPWGHSQAKAECHEVPDGALISNRMHLYWAQWHYLLKKKPWPAMPKMFIG